MGVEGNDFVRIYWRKYNGFNTLFSAEPWMVGEVIQDYFSRLFNFLVDQNVSVKDVVISSGLKEGGRVGEEFCLIGRKS